MRAWLGVALVACFVLSGCSSSGKGSTDSQTEAVNFTDLDAKVSATTGGIKGIVVDTAIVPVAKATVKLTGQNVAKNTTTDSNGRFLFAALQPGTYFLATSAPLYHPAQTSVEVMAGLEPSITKIQIQAIYSQKPYHVPIEKKGFFECSQAGALIGGVYASSNCVVDQCPALITFVPGHDAKECNGYPTHMMDNVTSQNREWHADVGPGWQVLVFEMTWTPSAQGTSDRLGMVVSTYKPERNPQHDFASVSSGNPMRFELDLNKTGPGAQQPAGTLKTIPPEGLNRMSFFVSVRSPAGSVCNPVLGTPCVPPGLAVNQDFKVFLTQFYYGIPPEGWSFVKGDAYPF
jgi:hypothetical protein